MQNQNKLLAKAEQINICGLIGMGLAILGMVLPMLRVGYGGMGMSFTLFTDVTDGGTSLWVLFPLLLAAGAAALYVMKMDIAGALGNLVAFVAFIVVLEIKYAIFRGEAGGSGASVSYSIGFYLVILGTTVALAAPWINKLLFKMKPKAPQMAQFDPNMNQQYGGPQMNQFNQQAGQYMNQAGPQMNQFNQQAGQYMNQAGQQMNQFAQQPGQFANQANPYMNQAGQMQNMANQAADQANQFVQNGDVPNDFNNQQ